MSDHRATITVKCKGVQEHQISHLMRAYTQRGCSSCETTVHKAGGAVALELMRADNLKARNTCATAEMHFN